MFASFLKLVDLVFIKTKIYKKIPKIFHDKKIYILGGMRVTHSVG